MEGIPVSDGQKVLLLWCPETPPGDLQTAVEQLSETAGPTGKVQLEHIDRLTVSGHAPGIFDMAISGLVQPCTTIHSGELLAELARVLKPGGHLFIREPITKSRNDTTLRVTEKISTALKLAGYVDITKPSVVSLGSEDCEKLKVALKREDVEVVQLQAKKPNYEVGSSSQLKLSFAHKTEPKVDDGVAQVWALSANDIVDDDVEVMDSDDLLDDSDLLKPDPASLRIKCGDGSKKKACKNCSCGLAEELESEKSAASKAKEATSACGNCYLGDAFRCSSCPYLGMPAFKPGEKIQLSNRQLTADQ